MLWRRCLTTARSILSSDSISKNLPRRRTHTTTLPAHSNSGVQVDATPSLPLSTTLCSTVDSASRDTADPINDRLMMRPGDRRPQKQAAASAATMRA